MKKSLALFAALAAITGCQTGTGPEEAGRRFYPAATPTLPPPPAPAALTPAVYGTLTPSARQGVVADELRAIGKAIKAYQGKHNGQWPARLTVLVTDGLLPARALISAADPTAGKEGGVPDSYDQWQQSAEADEPACSFLYELCGATATWGWASYLGGKPTVADLDTDKNGEVSWQEAKLWQLVRGDTTQSAPTGYAKNRFPVVRCNWYGYPDSKDKPDDRTVISLAADLETVFLSKPWWEKDNEPVMLP